jgi:hypothetical protein
MPSAAAMFSIFWTVQVPSPATRALWVPLPFLRLHVVKNKPSPVHAACGTGGEMFGLAGRRRGMADAPRSGKPASRRTQAAKRVLRGSTVPERRRPAAPDNERELGVRVRPGLELPPPGSRNPHACMAALLAIGFRVWASS